MASTLTSAAPRSRLKALRRARRIISPSPARPTLNAGDEFRRELIAKVKALARGAPRGRDAVADDTRARDDAASLSARPRRRQPPRHRHRQLDRRAAGALPLVAALRRPNSRSRSSITQHMPATFTADPGRASRARQRLAARRSRATARRSRPGRIYLAPGDYHMWSRRARRAVSAFACRRRPPENFCRPVGRSDAAQRSPRLTAARVLAAMLTGMGRTGSAGADAVVAAGGAVDRPGRGDQRGLGHARRGGAGRAVQRACCRLPRSRPFLAAAARRGAA